MYDEVERIWDGGTAYIIGGGPSLRNFNFELLKSCNTIGVNHAYRLGSDIVKVAWWGDAIWFDDFRHELEQFHGLMYHCCSRDRNYGSKFKRIERAGGYGISTDPRAVNWNNSSGTSAINLAYLLGARRLVLLGFDMRFDAEKNSNWHDWYKERHANYGSNWDPFDKFLDCFPVVSKRAQELDFEIINACPNSAIEHFPKITLEEAFDVDCCLCT